MNKPTIYLLVFLIGASVVLASYSSDFDYRKADRIVAAQSEGLKVDQFLYSYYMDNFQKGDCADFSCTAKESANESDCKCNDLTSGEMCFDIFTRSTASETGPPMYTHATDYCLNSSTLMEGFVNCVWLDHSYWVQIDCPEGFRCSEGACKSRTNTSIGPVHNITIDDNGTITHADFITINGTRISNLTYAVLGQDDSIESARSLDVDSLHYENVSRMRFLSPVLRDVSYAELPDVFWGGMVVSNTSNVSIRQDPNSRSMDVDIRGGSFGMENPVDGTKLLFSGESLLNISSGNRTLSVNASALDVLIGFSIPAPPFIRIIGNKSSFMEYMRDGKLHYFVKDAEFIFDGGNFQELVKAGSGTDIEVDYQKGIICSNLSNRAGYYYLDKRQGPSSYGIENRYSASYVFCSRKQGAPVQEKKEGYADLVKSTLNLTGAVAYLRPSEGSNGSSGMFADLYASNSTVNAFFDMSGSMIRGMMLAPSPVAGTHTHMSYFSVIEDNARYAYVGEKRHDFVRQYDASGSDAAITVIGDTLVQQSPTSRVTIFGPGTEALKNYEATLYETGT